jgi:hypothetical protein
MKTTLSEKLYPLKAQNKISGIRIGHIQGVGEEGQLLVDFPGNLAGPIPARFAESLKNRINLKSPPNNAKALIVFEDEDPLLPIVVDTICETIEKQDENDAVALQLAETESFYIEGKRIRFDAKEQVELRCGKASITLTRAGKVIIRGAYLLNRSSGVNRIKGGSVQIN